MKLISSIVRPTKFDDVKQALASARVYGLKVEEVHDHSPQKHDTMVWLGREYSVGCSVKMQIDVVVHDEDVDDVVGAIIKTARTGAAGDGHVLVISVEHRYNICDGNRDVS